MHSDAFYSQFGRCGEDEPVVNIPTAQDDTDLYKEGALVGWDYIRHTWRNGLEHLGVTPHVRAF